MRITIDACITWRSKGLRPNQRAFSLGCEAKITDLWRGDVNLSHNHQVSEDILKHYRSSRRLSKEEVKAVSENVSLKPKNKHVQDMDVRKYRKFVTLKDIKTRCVSRLTGI